jgi:myo-inositol 2-dehydrogenase/D-chiro-inositol 1-dehydrogenase
MTESLKVAVIGAGVMGLAHIKRITGRIKGADVVAVVEPDQGRAQAALAAAPGSQWFGSVPEMIAAGIANAVVVVSPGQFHEEALHATLDAGLPTLCEKPMAMTAEAGKRIVEHEAKLPRRLIQVGFHRRYDRDYQSLHALIRSGEAGQVLALHCRHRNPSLPPGWDNDMLIEDAAAHEMDIVPWLVGEPVVSVEVHKAKRNSLTPEGVHDPILILLRTESGVLADVEINMNFQAAYEVSTEAVLERGSAKIGHPEGMGRVQGAQFYQAVHQLFTARFIDAYNAEFQSWVDAVRVGGTPDGATAWDGYRAVALCEAGMLAQHQDARVDVPQEKVPGLYS